MTNKKICICESKSLRLQNLYEFASYSFLRFEDLTVSDLQRLHSCEYVDVFVYF